MKRVFLDNAATTPISPSIISMMSDMMANHFANPSSSHYFGRESKNIVEQSRKKIAKLINTSPGSIFFTSGGTESDNMAIQCSIANLGISHAITSKLSHHAVLYPLEEFESKGLVKLSYVNTDKNGVVSLDHLDELLSINDRTFVSIMHANNEIGTIQDIKKIGDICFKYDAVFHSDTVQTVGHYNFNLQELNIHFLAASAHKFHGPKGIGFIYISDDIEIKPLMLGGSQERNMRPGTENIYGIAALAMAMEEAYSNLEKDIIYIKSIKSYMIEKIKLEIPGSIFYANSEKMEESLYTVLTVSFPETEKSEMFLFNLDIMGIACSGGSACASGVSKGSHVLNEIISNAKRPGVRFSFSKHNTTEEIDYTVSKIKSLYSK
ncbi:MAG: cysteine desulfurase [Flavobacteriales bacterium]|nr:cysteine desulfurase [Flavobacteriales bacterium]